MDFTDISDLFPVSVHGDFAEVNFTVVALEIIFSYI